MSHRPEVAVPIGRFSELAQWRSVYEWDLDFVRRDNINVVFRCFRWVDDCGHGHGAQVLTGITARAFIRKAIDYPISYELTCVVDEDDGLITVSATSEQTGAYGDFGLFELQISDGTPALVKTIVQGKINVVRDIIY